MTHQHQGAAKKSTDSLSPDELVLALIKLSDGYVPGALYIQKIAFLAANEGATSVENTRKKLKYQPLNFGPYSRPLRESLDRLLAEKKLVSKTLPSDKYNKEAFYLTESGRDAAGRVIESLDQDSRKYLTTICKGAKQLGYAGILRYVYSKYPDFTTKSDIIQEVTESYDYSRSH